MRFHSGHLRLDQLRTCIAIEYHRAAGIMADLRLGNWVVLLHEATAEKLTGLFDRMVRERDAYMHHLRESCRGIWTEPVRPRSRSGRRMTVTLRGFTLAS